MLCSNRISAGYVAIAIVGSRLAPYPRGCIAAVDSFGLAAVLLAKYLVSE